MLNNPGDPTKTISHNLLDLEISNNHYKLKLNDIKMVDSESRLYEFLDEVLLCSNNENDFIYVGVDSEWKPTCVTNNFSEDSICAALIQISTHRRIYLLDVVALKDLFSNKKIIDLFTNKFLFNKRIVKVGYGFTQDLKIIGRTFNLTDLNEFRETVLDLGTWINHVIYF